MWVPSFMAYGFQQTNFLDRKIGPLMIKDESIDRILERISRTYDIPMGIDLADEMKSADRQVDVDFPETVLRSVLDYLVQKDPRYRWKLEGQVVHFFPITDRDDFLSTLLDTKLKRVSFSSQLLESDMRYEILSLPEINAKLMEANVEPLMFEMGFPSKQQLGVSLEYSNLTLRELLDQITLRTNRKFWVLTRGWDRNRYIALRL